MKIIVYVCDALRADHLGCYGYARPTSPHLDALARAGVVFENCFTATTWTRPVAASILTGVYPAVHLTRTRQNVFSTSLPRLPEWFRAGGFATAAFSAMANVGQTTGFGRGFDHYTELFRDPQVAAKRCIQTLDLENDPLADWHGGQVAIPYAEDLNAALIPWLEEHAADRAFCFVWSVEPHAPYLPPPEFRRFSTPDPMRPQAGWPEDLRSAGPADRDRLVDLYDDEIVYNDHCLGELVAFLQHAGLYDETCLIVVGDHGEAFYEHGFYGHGYAPYEEQIHVPLLMKFPGGRHAGRRVGALVELIDLLPTLLAVADLTSPNAAHLQGHDLTALLDGRRDTVRDYAFSDTCSPDTVSGHQFWSVRSLEWKYIQVQRTAQLSQRLKGTWRRGWRAGRRLSLGRIWQHWRKMYTGGSSEFLFHLAHDPGEKHNLAAQQPARLQAMRQALATWQARNSHLATTIGSQAMSQEENEELRQQLAALGYL